LLRRLYGVVRLRCPLRWTLGIRRWSVRSLRHTLLELICIVKAGVSALATTEPFPAASLSYDDPETTEYEERKDSRGQEQESCRFLQMCQY
jgi:hypothetical protein